MLVEVIGVSSAEDSTKLHHHRWILNAEPDQGPYVPAIPIRALLRNVYRIPPGARACIDELPLSEYVASMHDIGVHTQIQQETFDYLFQSALGAGWQSLTPVARRSHSFVDKRVLTGEAKIRRGDSWLTQLVASVFRFPQAIDRTPVKVTKTRMGRSEVWVRDFGGQTFHSILSAPQPQRENSGGTPIATIQEQFGVMKFTLQMPIIDNVMHMSVLNGSCLGIPIPKFLLPISNTQEFSENDTLRFSVELLAPFNLGLIVHYEGWLK